MSLTKPPRRRAFPTSLTDLHRLGKSVHGHDGSSRIVMVRKTDQRTFASSRNGKEPKLETITRETIETFRGQRTACKITTEKKDFEDQLPIDLISSFNQQYRKNLNNNTLKKTSEKMEFALDCLKWHNEYRAKHDCPPMTLNEEMCQMSEKVAKGLIKQKVFGIKSGQQSGENIYFSTSSDPNSSAIDGEEPVKYWYDEIKYFIFGREPKTLRANHFTQLVWKETKEIGVGIAKKCQKVVVVVNYSPSGNVMGQFNENVPPPIRSLDDNIRSSLCQLNLSDVTDSQRNLANGTSGDFEVDFLNSHNEFRERHGVPPLKLDKKLCKHSEEWARILTSKNNLEHRKNSPYGENIYCIYSSDPSFTITGHAPVETWYDEIKHHPFGREPNSLKSGHFTQVIWKTSEFLGVGVAKSRQGYIYVVANYSPAGNFLGNFAENVPPPIKTPTQPISKKMTNDSETVEEEMDSEGFDKFVLEGLKVHNEYRKKHGVGEMTLSKQLCDYANEWAQNCSKAGNMAHRPNNTYGENIFCLYSSDFSFTPTARDAVKKWYDEIKDHKFGTESVNYSSLHFSQVIWRNSTKLGIALSKNNKGQSYVVANYEPRGNVVGQFINNVPKLKA